MSNQPPLNERHCRAEMPGHPGVLCGRHLGHSSSPRDAGHRQRGEDGGNTWPNEQELIYGFKKLGLPFAVVSRHETIESILWPPDYEACEVCGFDHAYDTCSPTAVRMMVKAHEAASSNGG